MGVWFKKVSLVISVGLISLSFTACGVLDDMLGIDSTNDPIISDDPIISETSSGSSLNMDDLTDGEKEYIRFPEEEYSDKNYSESQKAAWSEQRLAELEEMTAQERLELPTPEDKIRKGTTSTASEVYATVVIAEADSDPETNAKSVQDGYNRESSTYVVEITGSTETGDLTIVATHIESGISSTKTIA